MKYIVDFIDTASELEINAWLTDNNCTVVKQFNHFTKTYLVKASKKPKAEGIVEFVYLDSTTTALKLHDTYVAPKPIETLSFDSTNDQNWWKTLVFHNSIQENTAVVNRIGAGYPVYIMDSGIKADHPDFANANVRQLFSFTNDFADYKGHGTAIASVISGSIAGISSADVISVKIFQGGTPTLVSDLINGLDAVAADYVAKYPNVPGIVNMSWGIDKNEFVESKIQSLANLGLVIVVAAGNAGVPIADVTPAGMASVLTIGSIDSNLQPSDFSNYTGENIISNTNNETNHGEGLDYWAPGEAIYSANFANNGYGNTAGTSIAAAVFSATLVHNLASHNFVYDLTPVTLYSSPLIVDILKGTNKVDGTINASSIKDLLTAPNIILPSQDVVHLTEKYASCTKKAPVIHALTPTDLKSIEENRESKSIYPEWYNGLMFVNKDEAQHIPFLNYGFVDSATLDNLPAGLSLNGLYITGTMTEDLGTNMYKVYQVPAHFVRGEKTLDATVSIVYYDRSKFGNDLTPEQLLEELNKNANIVLMDLCWDCFSFSFCSVGCSYISPCVDKSSFTVCGF